MSFFSLSWTNQPLNSKPQLTSSPNEPVAVALPDEESSESDVFVPDDKEHSDKHASQRVSGLVQVAVN